MEAQPNAANGSGSALGCAVDPANRMIEVCLDKLEELKCCICMGILKRPVRLPCMHRFCEICAESWTFKGPKDQKKCPLCKNAQQLNRRLCKPDLRLERLISLLYGDVEQYEAVLSAEAEQAGRETGRRIKEMFKARQRRMGHPADPQPKPAPPPPPSRPAPLLHPQDLAEMGALEMDCDGGSGLGFGVQSAADRAHGGAGEAADCTPPFRMLSPNAAEQPMVPPVVVGGASLDRSRPTQPATSAAQQLARPAAQAMPGRSPTAGHQRFVNLNEAAVTHPQVASPSFPAATAAPPKVSAKALIEGNVKSTKTAAQRPAGGSNLPRKRSYPSSVEPEAAAWASFGILEPQQTEADAQVQSEELKRRSNAAGLAGSAAVQLCLRHEPRPSQQAGGAVDSMLRGMAGAEPSGSAGPPTGIPARMADAQAPNLAMPDVYVTLPADTAWGFLPQVAAAVHGLPAGSIAVRLPTGVGQPSSAGSLGSLLEGLPAGQKLLVVLFDVS